MRPREIAAEYNSQNRRHASYSGRKVGACPNGIADRSVPAAPATLPRDADGLEVVFPMRAVAGDAVEFHRVVAIYRERERRAKTHAFLLVVVLHVIDRRAASHEVTGIQRQPPAGRV